MKSSNFLTVWLCCNSSFNIRQMWFWKGLINSGYVIKNSLPVAPYLKVTWSDLHGLIHVYEAACSWPTCDKWSKCLHLVKNKTKREKWSFNAQAFVGTRLFSGHLYSPSFLENQEMREQNQSALPINFEDKSFQKVQFAKRVIALPTA